MRGGSQSQLMRCDDQHLYVVKFLNNPQHQRVLANEFLGTRLAQLLGLPVPESAIIEVGEWLIEHTPELHIQLAHNTVRCQSGLHFGSRYAVDPIEGQVFDYLSAELLAERVRNLDAFAGILAFDKWTGNADGRQAAFWRYTRERLYTACFIDHGYCFNAGEWTFPDYPLRGVYGCNDVYARVVGWRSFRLWLDRIENISLDAMLEIVNEMPPEWYGNDRKAVLELLETLHVRRRKVMDLIEAFRDSPRRPFPRWRQVRAHALVQSDR